MSSLRRGVRLLLSHKKAVCISYAANLLAAALVFFPFAASFEESLGPGLHRTEMVETIDYDWYELIQDRGERLLATFSPTVTGAGPFARNLEALVTGGIFELPAAIVAAGLLYILLNAFISAAAIGSFAQDPRGVSFREFHRTGGEFFGRFLRIALVAMFTFAVLYRGVLAPIRNLVDGITADATVDWTVFYWGVAASAILLTVLAIANMVFDYAKIIIAAEDRTSVFLAFLSALTFCVAFGLPALGLHLLIGAVGVVWALLCLSAEQWVPQAGWWGIAAAAAIQQLYIIGRLAVRFLFYTAQMEFFLDREGLYRPERRESEAITM